MDFAPGPMTTHMIVLIGLWDMVPQAVRIQAQQMTTPKEILMVTKNKTKKAVS
jgi:hypothetical protein